MNTGFFTKCLGVLTLFGLLAACSGSSTSESPVVTITAQPTDQSVLAGATATFEVVASNATGYQWQRSSDGGTTFTDIDAATAASHTTPATTLADSGTRYRVVVSGNGMSVTSSTVTLTVTAVAAAPSISVHPANQTISAGQNASFSVTAVGTALSYQWQQSSDGGASFTDIASATNATLTLTAVPLTGNARQYRVAVSNSVGSVTSNAATLTVNAVNVPRFAYVANRSDNTVSIYTVNAVTGRLRHNGYALAGAGPQSVTVDPSGKFVYVANELSNDVSAYTVDAATGALTAVAGSPFVAGSAPQSVTVDSSGKFVYVANNGSNNVSAYTIDAATGALTAVAGSPFATGAYASPYSVIIEPNGKYAYVANGQGTISAYAIDPATGALTAVAGSPFAAGNGSYSLAVDPTGRFVYVANGGGGTVSAYAIDVTTGSLTDIGSVVAEWGLRNITVDPSGKFVYVANQNQHNVSAFRVNATTGVLTAVAGSPFAAGSNSYSVVVDPSGRFAYTTNKVSNDISAFGIDATTGALTALPTVAGRPGNAAMAMTKGTAAVTYTPKFAYAANYGPDIVSAYSIDAATGALTSLADTPTLSLGTSVTVDPSGRFAYTTHEVLFETPTVNVSTYTIDSTSGVLTRVGAAAAVASFPASITVEPSGRFAYVANSASDSVSTHTIDAATGALTYVGWVAAETGPSSIVVDPSGRFAYVANNGFASISGYAVNASSGALAAIDLNGALVGTALGTGPNPTSVTVDPSGKFVYVTHLNGINAYVIDTATGLLINASSAAAGANPRSVAVEPSGRFAYVANADSDNVSVFSINPMSGALTGIDTVLAGDEPWSVAVDLSGRFAYVANRASNDVSIFAINTTTGALMPVGTAAAGAVPVSIAIAGTIQ